MTETARLVGDGIENPANARALMDAAAMFSIPCVFRDTARLCERWDVSRGNGEIGTVGDAELLAGSWPLVAVDNAPGAGSVYDCTVPAGGPAIVVGNERRGVRGDVLRAASRRVEIPMSGRGINTLNVASAAAVALYYLLGAHRRPMRQTSRPEERRPAVLLLAPLDHVEAGSAIRSAAAFGWRSVGLDDRHAVWFGVPRSSMSEGRAAARSHRNPTRVVPVDHNDHGFSRVIVAGVGIEGPHLHAVDLAGGGDTVVVVPDQRGSYDDVLGSDVERARVPLPDAANGYRYRLVASIVLAEVARQVGRRPAGRPAPRGRPGLTYESGLRVALGEADLIGADELRGY